MQSSWQLGSEQRCNRWTNVKPQFYMMIAGFENGAGVLQLGGIIEDISKARCLSRSPGPPEVTPGSCWPPASPSALWLSWGTVSAPELWISEPSWASPTRRRMRHCRHGPLDAEADGPSQGLQMPPGPFAAPGGWWRCAAYHSRACVCAMHNLELDILQMSCIWLYMCHSNGFGQIEI